MCGPRPLIGMNHISDHDPCFAQLFRDGSGSVWAAEIKTGERIEAGIPKLLFKYAAGPAGVTYAVTADGKRFLVLDTDRDDTSPQIMVVLNWTAELKK